ncbi:MAG: DNA repair protein RecO [Clostridia bacterium]|nr:DNA repair protein RecO [Clostridia bacterium]
MQKKHHLCRDNDTKGARELGIVEAEGIITREIKYGDSSRILTILTKEFGKISVLAGGVRTNKSGLLAATQLFSHVSLQLFKGREKSLYKINSGEIVTSFSGIRESLEKMAYASYFCEVANDVIQENAPDMEQLNLLLNTLFLLSQDKLPYTQIKGVFEFRTLALQGLLPDLSVCDQCGNSPTVFFCPSEASCYCASCGDTRAATDTIHAGEAVLSAISYITLAESKKVFAFTLPESSCNYLSKLGEYCLTYYLERQFQTLNYLNKVCALGG